MHTNIWDKTYIELRKRLKREPTTREVQRAMLDKMFNGSKEQ
jgi:hypothetical protein